LHQIKSLIRPGVTRKQVFKCPASILYPTFLHILFLVCSICTYLSDIWLGAFDIFLPLSVASYLCF
jgi:hypothetical protein